MADISEPFRWNGVELRHLVALRTVAEEGSLAGAALRLGYSFLNVRFTYSSIERSVSGCAHASMTAGSWRGDASRIR